MKDQQDQKNQKGEIDERKAEQENLSSRRDVRSTTHHASFPMRI